MKAFQLACILFIATLCFFSAAGFLLTGLVKPGAASAQGTSGWYVQQSNTFNNLNSVDAVDENTAWAVGDNGTVLRTINGGENRASVSSGVTFNVNAVCAIDSNTAWVVGDNSILRTDDGG